MGRSSIDYLVKAAPTDAAGTGELAKLRGVQVPVKLTGPLNAISYQVQWSALPATLLQQSLSNKLGDALKQKLGVQPAASSPNQAATPTPTPQDRLKDKLRGFLK